MKAVTKRIIIILIICLIIIAVSNNQVNAKNSRDDNIVENMMDYNEFKSNCLIDDDREKDEVYYGRVPAGSVVVSGNLPSKNGKYSLYAAIIVKRVDEKTLSKVGINNI